LLENDEAELGHAVGEIARRLVAHRQLAALDQRQDVLGLMAVIHDVEDVIDLDAVAKLRLEPVADELERLGKAGGRRAVAGHLDCDRRRHFQVLKRD